MYDDMFYILHILSFQKTSILPIPPLDGLINTLILLSKTNFSPLRMAEISSLGDREYFLERPIFVYFNLFKHS